MPEILETLTESCSKAMKWASLVPCLHSKLLNYCLSSNAFESWLQLQIQPIYHWEVIQDSHQYSVPLIWPWLSSSLCKYPLS